MSIYAISDLHLSGFKPKPMDVFGENWIGHWDKIRNDWRTKVCDDDIVLIPGDISWAMKMSEAAVDLDEICKLNGCKILLKGNHDYWWSSLSKFSSVLSNKTYLIQNNSLEIGGYIFAGTRGWSLPSDNGFSEQDEKIYMREIERLKLSLESAKVYDKKIIVLMHYPPMSLNNFDNGFIETLLNYDVEHVVYGHLHDKSAHKSFNGEYKGIQFKNVSCDFLDFKLYKIK